MACETTKREIALPVNIAGTTQETTFYVIEGDMRYNALFSRLWIHNMRDVPSTLHQVLKFPTLEGIKMVYGEKPAAKEIFVVDESSTGATSFSLVYGTEALIPVEVGVPSIRFRYITKESNDKAMNTSLELLDERREATLVRLAAQKQQIKRYYIRRANLRYFNIGELVLRKVTLSTQNPNEGKLGPNWEGPYRILEVTGKGSYKLGMIN
ncbi:PREDICTED: uncharacterized protein LOC109236774 [Nicotiana attenuata]|uniref:uncharacterized protein LOC109236774 n=1 Tax=Nicotiana attenuata TaxID=49451 RepID=UPI000904F214|nr:PREDICTED: uncharacterized protein LOC109236774 [Nicotiana attenuata]